MTKAPKEIQVKALQMYLDEIEKLIEKGTAKRGKEIEKIKKRTAVLGDFKTEDEIMDAYGYANITAKERDQLLNDLETAMAAGQSALGETTVLTEYLRMLRKDKSNLQIEVQELASL